MPKNTPKTITATISFNEKPERGFRNLHEEYVTLEDERISGRFLIGYGGEFYLELKASNGRKSEYWGNVRDLITPLADEFLSPVDAWVIYVPPDRWETAFEYTTSDFKKALETAEKYNSSMQKQVMSKTEYQSRVGFQRKNV